MVQSESSRTDLTNSLLFGWYCVPEFPIGIRAVPTDSARKTWGTDKTSISNIRQPLCTDSYNVCIFLLLQYEKWSITNFSLSGDGETHLSRSLFPEMDKIAEPEKTNLDKEAEESDSSDFEGRSEDMDSIISVEREEDNDHDMPRIGDNVTFVRDSKDFGVESDPIFQNGPSINDSVSEAMISITTIDLQWLKKLSQCLLILE